MMREFKYVLIGLALVAFVFMVYLATQMSAVYDPIKTYQLRKAESEVHAQLTKISIIKPNLKITFADSIGTEKEGLDYHCDIAFKDVTNEYAFHFIYKGNNHEGKSAKSEIELISAIDYGLKIEIHEINHKEASRLIDIFEKEIINKLSEKNTSR